MIALLFLNSCRQDLMPEKETYHNTSAFQVTSKRISLNESKHSAKLLPELKEVAAKFKSLSKTDIQGKIINYGNGISIDTDYVTYIENGPNFHTYTFNITRENTLPTDPVENLVLVPMTNGTYKELLVTYNLTNAEKQVLKDGGSVDTKGKTEVIEISTGNQSSLLGKGQSCGFETTTYYQSCASGEHMPGEDGCKLKYDERATIYTVTNYVCYNIYDETETGGGGDYYGPGGGTDSGTGGESQSPGTTPCNGNGVATGPLDPNTNIGEGGCSGVPTSPNIPPRPIINIDDNLDAKIKCLLQKMAGDTNLTDDIITLPKTSTNDDLFQKMLRKFNGVDAPQLSFKYDPNVTGGGAYASTFSYDGGVTYEIKIGTELANTSNIRAMSVLAHELTHAFMLNDLTKRNMIEWYSDGLAYISPNAQKECAANKDFVNDNPDDYIAALICLYIINPAPQLGVSNQWMHEIFGMSAFDMQSYIGKLSNYVKDKHDWASESANWNSAMQNKYGSNWKNEVSMNLQMDGIRQTNYFATKITNQTFTQFHNEVVSIIDNGLLPNSNNNFPANKSCN